MVQSDEVLAWSGAWLNRPLDAQSIQHALRSAHAFSAVRGPVQGLCLDSARMRFVLHADSARQRPLFYFHQAGVFAFASSMHQLVSLLRNLHVAIVPSEQAAALLMTFASIPGDLTLVDGVKKLSASCTLVYENGKVTIEDQRNYAASIRTVRSLTHATEALESAFSRVVQLGVSYNETHGFTPAHLLSGGIDSRMVLFAAAKQCTDIHTMCFSKSGYLDEKISAQIAARLHTQHRFVSLGDGDYITHTESVEEYDGTINYLASAHHRYALAQWPLHKAGLIFSGQLGNELLHDFYMPEANHHMVSASITTWATGVPLVQDYMHQLWMQNPDSVRFKLQQRAFLYTNSAAYSTLFKGILYAPFADPDVIDVMLSLHPDLLRHHRLYFEWMRTCYPKATDFAWERYNAPPKRGLMLQWAKWKTKARIRLVHRPGQFQHGSMSPIDYWYRHNPAVHDHLDHYYKQHSAVLRVYPQLSALIDKEFSSMTALNKASVYTLIASTKAYCAYE